MLSRVKITACQKILHGSSMQNVVIGICEKFHDDRLSNDRALVLWKFDNNNPKKHKMKKNNVGSVWVQK